MASPSSNLHVGSFIGTGASLTIKSLPNKVKCIELYNVTSGDALYWQSSMADAAGVKQVAAGTRTFITANGITPYGGADGQGFTLGADADLNVAGEVVHFRAFYE
jgi:hypothetical protein